MFFLHTISGYILRHKITLLKQIQNTLLDRNRELNEQNKLLTEELKSFKKNRERLLRIVEEKKGKKCSLTVTNTDEIVLIFEEGVYKSTLHLYGTNSDFYSSDSEIQYSVHGFQNNIIKIDCLQSFTYKKGYARTLMLYFINKMIAKKITEIYGDLSPNDKNSFNWLIPFYESLGFTCTLPTNNEFGKLRMILTYNEV